MVRTRGKGQANPDQDDAPTDDDNILDSENSEKSAVLKPTRTSTSRSSRSRKSAVLDDAAEDIDMEQACPGLSRTNSRSSSTTHPRVDRIKRDELGEDVEHDGPREAGFVCEVSTEDTPGCKKGKRHREARSRTIGIYREEMRSHTRNERILVDTDYLSESEEDVDNGDVEYIEVRGGSNRHYKDRSATNGIRRSTRQRKPTQNEANGSWIFGTQNPKGYPAYDEEQEDDGGCRRSSRLRSSRQPLRPKQESTANGNEHETGESGKSTDEETGDDGSASTEDDDEQDYEKEVEKKPRRVQTYRKNRRKQLSNDEDEDMYTKVKRHRTTKTRYVRYRSALSKATRSRPRPRSGRRRVYHRYTVPSTDGSPSEDESENSSDQDMEMTEAADKEENTEGDPIEGRNAKGKYTLRKIRPAAKLQSLENKSSSRSSTPPPRYRRPLASRLMCSPAHRSLRRPRQTAQNESSTSSSSDDDERFERRKNKSMIKARNRCLPMNLTADDLTQGVLKDRSKVGSSLADVDPMAVDKNVTFESIGGLDTYIRSLKEMILFPLLYPEVFHKFSIQPPRGVLFYGPPGTGKTLVARALSNECSQESRRVAFFMRKGADCLSKWVGESERQLRLLFDQAYQMRPAIIFFDEIDGLAPVRSTRQDQIHSSIVSTLLALMDGLDSRGEVVVIGATNRLDAIDPALRRPGRFDREFFFPLPSVGARKEILNIHLKSWQPSPAPSLVHALAEKTVGYCGADLKALCAEAALISLRRRYPQIYESKQKLLLDLTQISVEKKDFLTAMGKLVPASHRAGNAVGKPLSATVAPLLKNALQQLINTLAKVFPRALSTLNQKGPVSQSKPGLQELRFSPRLYVAGDQGCHLTAALLHYLERVPVHRLDLTTLYGLSVRSPEEACVQIFQEARRNVPAIVYLPQVSSWWGTLSETVRATLFTLIRELDPELPVMLLVSDEIRTFDTTEDLQAFFEDQSEEVFAVPRFTEEERRSFFSSVVQAAKKPPLFRRKMARSLEVLPVAPPPAPRQLSSKEKARLEMKEEFTLRELRIFLREVLAKLARNKQFYMFTRPVDVEAVPDYKDIVKEPMDLETMMTKIDNHCYESAKDFLADIDLICNNALEYNPSKTPEDKLIRHRAFTLRDTAYALIKAEMDTDFEDQCQEISRARKTRETAEERSNAPEPSVAAVAEEMAPSVAAAPAETRDKPDAVKSKRKKSCWARGVVPSRRSSKRSRTDDSVNSTEPDKNDTAPQDSLSMDCTANESVATSEPITEQAEAQPTDELQDNYTAASQTESEAPEQRDESESNTSAKTLTVDEERLDEILGNIVSVTENSSVHDLLRLHGKLHQIVSRYSKLWDRVALPQELDDVIYSIQRRNGVEL